MILAYFPYSSSKKEVVGGRFLTFPEVNVSFIFFTIFSIFPKAITHLEIHLRIKGKSEEGKKWVLTVVSNPLLNMNGFIRKPTLSFLYENLLFFLFRFLHLPSLSACSLASVDQEQPVNLLWAKAALQPGACTLSLLQSRHFISPSLRQPTVQATK